jgi:phosphoenolpyruvate carboxylase
MAKWNVHIKGIATLQDRYDDHQITFDEMRDHVIKILRRKLAPYLSESEPKFDEELMEILDEFAEVDNEGYYDYVKNALYDWCDYNRVWIDPSN